MARFILLSLLALEAAAASAPYAEVCPNNLKTRLWAQLAVEADFLPAEWERLGITGGMSQVAVVDSGFDVPGNAARMASPKFTTVRGHFLAGRPDRDGSDHGTGVAGLVGGKDGVGIAPFANLAVYRHSTADDGRATHDGSNQSVLKACRDGYRIINLSSSATRDEVGLERYEKMDAALLAEVHRRGCLLVHASGNSSYWRLHESDRLDDALLRVGSVQAAGFPSSFSTRGELAAPGNEIYSLRSETNASPHGLAFEPNGQVCSGHPGRISQGTSVATPLVTGIAANVDAVLRALVPFLWDDADPEVRIPTLTRILKAAEVAGSISALRAVRIAEAHAKRLTSTVSLDVPSVAAFSALLVETPAPECTLAPAAATASDMRAFLNDMRRRLVLCPGNAGTVPQLLAAASAFVRAQNSELALRWLRTLDLSSLQAFRPEAKELADSLYELLQRKWLLDERPGSGGLLGQMLDFDEMLAVLPLYLNTRDGITKREETHAALDLFYGSDAFASRLARRDGRGSEADVERLRALWELVLSEGQGEALMDLLRSQSEDFRGRDSRQQSIEGAELLAFFRTLNSVLEAPSSLPFAEELKALEWKAFQSLGATNRVVLPRLADSIPIERHLAVLGSDMKTLQPAFLVPFYKRHEAALREEIGLTGGTLDARKLSAPFVYLLMREETGLSQQWRAEVAIQTLEAISQLRGWNLYEGRPGAHLTDQDEWIAVAALAALKKLYREHETAAPAIARYWKERYRSLFRRAVAPGFYNTQLRPIFEDPRDLGSLEPSVFAENPFLDRALVEDTAQRVLEAFPKLPDAVKERHASELARTLDAFAAWAVTDSNLLGGIVGLAGGSPWPLLAQLNQTLPAFGVIEDEGTSRLNPQPELALAPGKRKFAGELFAEIVGSWSEFMLKLSPEARANPDLKSMFYVAHENRLVCQALPLSGPWRDSLETLMRKVASESLGHGDSGFTEFVEHVTALRKACRPESSP